MLRALIWDVDGTIAETERDGHRIAFNCALQEIGAAWTWDEATYGRLLRVAGGLERLLADMQTRPDAPSDLASRERMARAAHQIKGRRYAEIVAGGGIALRPGVARLMRDCAACGIVHAVATTTGRSNVEGLFAKCFGTGWQSGFATIVCAEDAPVKKPDPSAYRIALDRLGLAACDVLAVEDSPNGLAAAAAAGIGTVVTRSAYFADERFFGHAAICDDLDGTLSWHGGAAPRADVDALRALHGAWLARQH
jgi:HAD superfamily hydrolase (TIGR01509 family)